jgi:hypothetical protein
MGRKCLPGQWDPEVNRKQRRTRLCRPQTPTHSHSERVERDFSLFRQKKPSTVNNSNYPAAPAVSFRKSNTSKDNSNNMEQHQNQHQELQQQQQHHLQHQQVQKVWSPRNYSNNSNYSNNTSTSATTTTALAAPKNLNR